MELNMLTDEQVLYELTQRVKRKRLNLNMTQETLANRAGVHTQTVKNFEAGKSTTMLTFIQLLRGFGELNALESFLPDPGISPIELLKLKGKERERASGNSSDDTKTSSW
ncbi:helix-turn-helix transcriptional regulator [Aquimarina sp. W85]|uniref:helix-turn-helix transcriptional regulator n=1 Tax=Aquimarina rhodophyticola TaxID=3342246 RepID=UPI00367149EB